jgi:hypothetical protein
VDGADLQMPKLMRHRNVRFGGEDFDLLAQVGRRYKRRGRIDSIRGWAYDAISPDRPGLRKCQMAAFLANRFVGPVVKSVLMCVDERECREHRDAKHTEQHLQCTKRRPNSGSSAHIAGQQRNRPYSFVTQS